MRKAPIDLADLLARYDRDERRAAVHAGFRREAAGAIVRHVDLSGRRGFVLYSRLLASDADAAIRGEIAVFTGLGQSFEWKLYDHDTPADLGARLEAHGLRAEAPETIMVLDLERAPAALMQPVACDVRRVTEPARFGELVAIQSRAWGDDRAWLGRQLGREMHRAPDRLGVYVARDDGVPASAAWIRFPAASAFGSLWGGATLPGHRGRGLYRALVAARVQEARRRGVRYLTVDAGGMSSPILERLGFGRLAGARGYVWDAPGSAGTGA